MNNIVNSLENKNKCFGCRACVNICPHNAIFMQEDAEGFVYPKIDINKCINCGLCCKICPSLNKEKFNENNEKKPECFALIGDDELRLKSSSGGAFTLIAEQILEQGGVICGAAYVDGSKVEHIIIRSKIELTRLRGSKYVQSNTNTVYGQIKRILKEKIPVLFVGTPCQVSGLKCYLGKIYDNLYTIDLICHGVPSQKILDKYIKEKISDDLFISLNFRDKQQGWGANILLTASQQIYTSTDKDDDYLQAFEKNMCLRPCCEKCPFAQTPREGDITLGDFWLIERFDKNLNDNKGTSLVLINNQKGKELFEKIKGLSQIYKEVPIEYAKYYNITLYTPLKQHTNRTAFFRLIKEGKTLKEAVSYCNKYKYDCAIMNFWPFKNYGGILNAYALAKVVQDLGYSYKLINYQIPEWRLLYKDSFIEKFATANLNTTEPIYDREKLQDLNKDFSTFIFGSDCIWCDKWFNDSLFLGDFVEAYKKKISYAPSFGKSTYENDDKNILRNKFYYQTFDAISIREYSGQKILKEVYNEDSTVVIDPTLLLSKEDYLKLIEKNNIENDNYIFNYSIGVNETDIGYKLLLRKISAENIFSLSQDQSDKISIEEWLSYIAKCKVLITNSYHACCMAIVLNKPFWICKPQDLDFTRFETLLDKVNLQNRIIDVKQIRKLDINTPINWNNVNQLLEEERKASKFWLEQALSTPKKMTENLAQIYMIQQLEKNKKANNV